MPPLKTLLKLSLSHLGISSLTHLFSRQTDWFLDWVVFNRDSSRGSQTEPVELFHLLQRASRDEKPSKIAIIKGPSLNLQPFAAFREAADTSESEMSKYLKETVRKNTLQKAESELSVICGHRYFYFPHTYTDIILCKMFWDMLSQNQAVREASD